VALLDGLAQYLDGLGLVDFRPDSTGGDCFIETLPASPDEAVALTLYGGTQPDSRLGYDMPSLQVRVRGTTDPRVSRARAEAIYAALHGLDAITLPDGTRMISCTAQQTVTSMGQDSQQRFEHVCNYALEVRNQTGRRE